SQVIVRTRVRHAARVKSSFDPAALSGIGRLDQLGYPVMPGLVEDGDLLQVVRQQLERRLVEGEDEVAIGREHRRRMGRMNAVHSPLRSKPRRTEHREHAIGQKATLIQRMTIESFVVRAAETVRQDRLELDDGEAVLFALEVIAKAKSPFGRKNKGQRGA